MKNLLHWHKILFRAAPWLLLILIFILSPVTTGSSAPAVPLDVPEVVVNELVDEFAITDGLVYWANKCWGGEFVGPGYLRRKPTHGGATLTLQTTTDADCYTFWYMNADASGVYYVNYETSTLDFRPTDDPTHATSLFTFSVTNDPLSKLDLDEDYIYWVAGNGNIYRLPKTGGSAVVIRSGRVGLRDIEIWGDNLYWLEDSGLYICSKPDCSSGTQVSTHTGNYLRSWLLGVFWVEQGSPQTIRMRACFWGCTESVLYTAPATGNWVINRPALGLCADGSNSCLYWEEYSLVVINGRLRRLPLSGGTAETIADNLLRGNNPSETDDLGVYFLLSNDQNNGLGRLPFTASVVERDLSADAWEVTQVLQSLDNDVPLVAHKPTYVRLYPDLVGTHANFVQAWLEGERGGVALPGSPLEPLNGPFALDDAWTYDRAQVNTSFLFQLPDAWTQAGSVTLRAVVDPREVYADLNLSNNTLAGIFTFTAKPPACDIFIPVRTHTPSISVETPNFWRMIDLQRRLWPVPDVWAYYQTDDVAEPQVCWWGIFPYPCSGPFELDEGTSWDDWVKDDEEALLHIGTRAAFSDDPDECDDLGSAVHYIGMVHPEAPWDWGGLAYSKDWLQPASLVVMPPFDVDPPLTWTWPWSGSTLAHETSHNHERKHVDCGNPADPDGSYPYPDCELDDAIDPTHYGFDPNLRQPIPPEIASDYMSYSGSGQSATWQGRWVSDYTYEAMFGRFSFLANLELPGPPSLAAADANVLVSALVDPLANQGTLHPAWVYPTTALSQGILEKWQALQAPAWSAAELSASAVSYHVRLRNAVGDTLADYVLTPLDTEVHQEEVHNLAFMQTFSAPAGLVTRLDLMADDNVLASLHPGPTAPTLEILLPVGGEVFSDTLTISWQATDPDPGDRLLFTVQYSPDGGLTWKSAVTNYPAAIEGDLNTLLLDDLGGLGASEGPNGMLRVAATDGYHTSLVDSEKFTVENQPPQPFILSPETTHYYPAGESVPLRGGALDPETGAVNNEDLAWSIAGAAYATGAEVNAAGLAPGTYAVKLQATDSDGGTASKTAYMNIARLEIPLAGASPKMDGICDDPQYQGTSLAIEPYGSGGQANVLLMRTADALWACFGGMLHSPLIASGYAGLRVDVNNSRDTLAQTDDYGFFVSEDGTPYTRAGDGLGGFDQPGPGGLLAQVSANETYWNAELRIESGVLGGWDHPVGIEIEQYRRNLFGAERVNWPYAAVYSSPVTWSWSILGDLPTILTLTPGTITAGNPTFTLTVDGEHFQDGAIVYWNTTALATTFIDSNRLTASVGAGLVSTGKWALITVRNPNSLSSNAVIFTVQNPIPVIENLLPAQAKAGSPGITLSITGSGFVEGSQVIWNGGVLPTTYVSANSLQAEITSQLLAYAGQAGVAVQNPQPSGGLSPQIDFIIALRGRIMLPVIEN